MEDFERAVNMLKREGISDTDWKFLALAIGSMIWSKECHDCLIEAVGIYKRDIGLDSDEESINESC